MIISICSCFFRQETTIQKLGRTARIISNLSKLGYDPSRRSLIPGSKLFKKWSKRKSRSKRRKRCKKSHERSSSERISSTGGSLMKTIQQMIIKFNSES